MVDGDLFLLFLGGFASRLFRMQHGLLFRFEIHPAANILACCLLRVLESHIQRNQQLLKITWGIGWLENCGDDLGFRQAVCLE